MSCTFTGDVEALFKRASNRSDVDVTVTSTSSSSSSTLGSTDVPLARTRAFTASSRRARDGARRNERRRRRSPVASLPFAFTPRNDVRNGATLATGMPTTWTTSNAFSVCFARRRATARGASASLCRFEHFSRLEWLKSVGVREDYHALRLTTQCTF